jgi:hypothetical protein
MYMKKIIMKVMIMALLVLPIGAAVKVKAADAPNWNVSGTYEWLVLDQYAHDMVLTMNPDGTFIGTGGYPAGPDPYETGELITNGVVSGDSISFTLTYTGPYATGSTWDFIGTIAPDGSMSGNIPMVWRTTSGVASVLPGSLAAEDFGVVKYDTGLGMIAGYTAGFGLTDNTFASATAVVVKLYSGVTLLQTNTAIIPKFNLNITGTQFSSPFDVSGTFNYVTDGYWTNVRESQYGQSMPATKVVAMVTLANGKVVTAENNSLVGDPTTIYPVKPPVIINPINKDQCKNNGWKNFTNPTFKNQGLCVSYVATKAKNIQQSRLLDTDKDGLTDFDEINIYHTDPFNPDTDGDGFNDGLEVRNGYNPNGVGRK